MKCGHFKILITGSCMCSQVLLRVHNVYTLHILWTLGFIDDSFVSIAMVTQVGKLYTFHNNNKCVLSEIYHAEVCQEIELL